MKKRVGIGAAVLGLAAAAIWWAGFGRSGAGPGPFRVGEQLIYRVEITSVGLSDFRALTGAKGDGGGHAVHTSLEGELVLTVLRREGDTVGLLCQVRGARAVLAGDGAVGLDAGRAASEQLAQPVAIEASPQGHIRRLWVPRDWSAASLGLLRNLLAAVQFVWPEGALSTWQVEQKDDHGTAVVGYGQKDGTVRRVRERYLAVDDRDEAGEQRITPVARPAGELTAEVDSGRRLVRLSGVETTTLEMDGRAVARTESSVGIELVRFATVGRREARELADARAAVVARGRETTLLNQTSEEAVEATIHRTELGELTLDEYLVRLANAGPDDETPLYLKGKALVYLQPTAAARFEALLAKAPADSRTARILIQALTGSGVPEAQRALANVVRARQADVAFQLEALPSLAVVRRPTAEVDRVLREVATGARDQDVRWTAQLALGALARALARSEPARAKAIVDGALRDLDLARAPEDRRQALLVLGNTASPRSLPAVRKHLSHADAGVRGGAVAALRWHASGQAEADLCRLLAGDPDDQVRQEAINAFEVREMTPAVVRALCHALAKDASEGVRLGALARLSRISGPGPDVLKAMKMAAESDPSEEVRRAAAEALGR